MSRPARSQLGTSRASPFAGNALNTLSRPSLPRATPRSSNAEASVAAAAKATPYTDLRQLASLIRGPATPARRASSAGPSPTTATRTVTALSSNRRKPRLTRPTTPHAIRALQQRRNAALTPGRERRRSGRREQRDTPQDALRNLSKLLAPRTRPVQSSPPSPRTAEAERIRRQSARQSIAEQDEDDLDVDAPRPEYTIPLEELEDDELEAAYRSPRPQRRSAAFDTPPSGDEAADSYNQASIEKPRRAVSEQLGGRYSRGSFGSIRFSDLIEEDVDESTVRFGGRDGEDFGSLSFGEVDLGDAVEEEEEEQPGLAIEDESPSQVFEAPQRSISQSADSTIGMAGEEDVDLEAPEPLSPLPDPHDLFSTATTAVKSNVARNTASAGKKPLKLSRHGTPYPSLPLNVVKKLATNFARTSAGGVGRGTKTKLGKDTMAAIMQATEWFFEQAGDDLGAYAAHRGGRTVESGDVVALMKRQRQVNATTTPFSLAQRYLPRELLQEIRMPLPAKVRKEKKSRRRAATLDEVDEGNV